MNITFSERRAVYRMDNTMTEDRRLCWQQNGFILFPRTVTHFYVLRYLQCMDFSVTDPAFTIHHQYLWDMRMYLPVYEAFSGVLGTNALWASLHPGETHKIEGKVCLQRSLLLDTQTSECRYLSVRMGDLLIYETDRFSAGEGSGSDQSWLRLTLIPAADDNVNLRRQRLHSWSARACDTYLSALGRKLLGLEPWAATTRRIST